MGSYYRDDPVNHEEARAAAFRSMKDRLEPQERVFREMLALDDFDPGSRPGGWTREAILGYLEAIEASVQRMADSQARYPAYLSAAIFVDEFPPEEVREEMR